MGNDKRLTLLELNGLVRELIEMEMPNEYWVEAELSECRESRGHCYMELVQYDEAPAVTAPSITAPTAFRSVRADGFPPSGLRAVRSAVPLARASAKCWASRWALIRPHFERTTGQHLHAGMKVLLKVYPQFHEAYGFSWIVTDIDPTYTLGDQARRRQEIIRQLKEEGVFDLQHELQLPLFCLHIAVISSQTAAGYGDFAAQLADSPFAFHTRLFPAIMQGEGVEQSIIAALEAVYEANMADEPHKSHEPYKPHESQPTFDCVVIIRGGGATSDMSGFDTLALAENVANFPIPIITGIGHDRDESILDMVSHQRVKTPTAAAAFLIDHAQTVYDALDDAQNRIARSALQRLADHKSRIMNLNTHITSLFSVVKTQQEARLDSLNSRMAHHARQQLADHQARISNIKAQIPLFLDRRIQREAHLLELLTEKVKALDPALLLKRGYSITLKDGHALHDPRELHPGDEIETRIEKGTIHSIVQ